MLPRERPQLCREPQRAHVLQWPRGYQVGRCRIDRHLCLPRRRAEVSPMAPLPAPSGSGRRSRLRRGLRRAALARSRPWAVPAWPANRAAAAAPAGTPAAQDTLSLTRRQLAALASIVCSWQPCTLLWAAAVSTYNTVGQCSIWCTPTWCGMMELRGRRSSTNSTSSPTCAR